MNESLYNPFMPVHDGGNRAGQRRAVRRDLDRHEQRCPIPWVEPDRHLQRAAVPRFRRGPVHHRSWRFPGRRRSSDQMSDHEQPPQTARADPRAAGPGHPAGDHGPGSRPGWSAAIASSIWCSRRWPRAATSCSRARRGPASRRCCARSPREWGVPLLFVEGNGDLTPARLLGHHNPARVLSRGLHRRRTSSRDRWWRRCAPEAFSTWRSSTAAPGGHAQHAADRDGRTRRWRFPRVGIVITALESVPGDRAR